MKKDEIGVEDILPFVGGICKGACDASILYLLAMGSRDWETQPDTFVFRFTARGGTTGPLTAIRQGKVLLAWVLLRCRWETDAWSILRKLAASSDAVLRLVECIIEFTTGASAVDAWVEFVWEARAAALLLVCGRLSSEPPHYLFDKELYESWTALEGKRARRIFPIRPKALSGVLSKNIQEIRTPLLALRGSPYWETVADEFGGWKNIHTRDESREAFFDLYFPDDIPDEWSTADQQKSHRKYTLTNTDDTLVTLYGTSPSLGLVVWTHQAIDEGLHLERYTHRQEIWQKIEATWDMTPRKKRICLKTSS
jgi:hypothetical protein